MIQFKIVSGKMAGVEKTARHFPFLIGRSASADFQVEEDGVWERHLEVSLDPARGYILTTSVNAIASVNGQSFQETVLRNGDHVEIGALKMRFWLGETHQSSLRPREFLTWTGFVIVIIIQFYLIYRLAH